MGSTVPRDILIGGSTILDIITVPRLTGYSDLQ